MGCKSLKGSLFLSSDRNTSVRILLNLRQIFTKSKKVLVATKWRQKLRNAFFVSVLFMCSQTPVPAWWEQKFKLSIIPLIILIYKWNTTENNKARIYKNPKTNKLDLSIKLISSFYISRFKPWSCPDCKITDQSKKIWDKMLNCTGVPSVLAGLLADVRNLYTLPSAVVVSGTMDEYWWVGMRLFNILVIMLVC